MGRIADAGDLFDTGNHTFTNKLDRILDELDADDRGIVLSWLASDMGDEEIEMRLGAFDIRCSDSTIRRWRNYQQRGLGRQWGA